jgi:hypothetical protein
MSNRAILSVGNGYFTTIAVFVGIAISIAVGLAAGSWLAFGVLFILSFVIPFVISIKVGKADATTSSNDMSDWLASVSHCQYINVFDGYGIAIDDGNRMVHLMGFSDQKRPIVKKYAFSDVREWGYEIPGYSTCIPGQVIGGGLQGAGHNVGSADGTGILNIANVSNAADGIGLWVRVKDIENPKWFIRFPRIIGKDVEMTLVTWMEILQQQLKER